MKWYITVLVLFLIQGPLLSQTKFIYSGSIEYERKINIQRQSVNDFIKDVMKSLPAFHNSLFALSFDTAHSLYYPSAEQEALTMPWIIGPAKENMVSNDFIRGTSTDNKQVFEKKYQVTDSLNKMSWRLSGETRTIAGFECKKAVGIMCDSVYVVAFYTEEIPVSSGPESFNGLPGMILGVVIPRLYVTWFATKLSMSPIGKIPPAPKKPEVVTKSKLQSVLTQTFQNWGEAKHRYIWWVTL